MRGAFKEWAVIVDALGRGEQIILLRKGGIHEGPEGFRLQREEFLLFPTQFHQQRNAVIPPAQVRFDDLARAFPRDARVRIDFFARVIRSCWLSSRAQIDALRGQHIWRDEVVEERLARGDRTGLLALAVRVFRLSHVADLPLLPAYGGCRSWVELSDDTPIDPATPVLTDEQFDRKLALFEQALAVSTLQT